MKKLSLLLMIVMLLTNSSHAQTFDFVPGYTVIFEDRFDQDPIGDLPARWSTSAGGEVVQLDGFDGKWFRIMGSMAVNPELKKKLPEDCTIEFDIVVKGNSCPVVFGMTPISDVSSANVYYKKIFVVLQNMTGYPDIVFGKDVQDLGSKGSFDLGGYVDRQLRVSISVNKTRFRVYLDDTKVVDLPKVMVPEYRNNFFVAGGEGATSPEGVFISNIRIAAGEADARRTLIKQLLEQGSVVTADINFNPQTNTMTQESFPVLDTLGQAMIQDPNLNIQINGMENMPSSQDNQSTANGGMMNEQAVQMKVDKMKAYLIQHFNLGVDRVVTGVSNKIKAKTNAVKNSQTAGKVRGFLTEIIKL